MSRAITSTLLNSASLLSLAASAGAAALAVSRAKREARTWVQSSLYSREAAEQLHDTKVERIARQLRERKSTKPLSLRKRAVPHQVPKAGDLRRDDEKIDISDLDAILHVDPERRVCVAEPGVSFVDLVDATMRYGLVPIVVPELKTITIGGAVAGCSLESMSYRYGGFHDTCLEYEVITARGEVLTCTPENQHKLIFQMMHGTFGTVGVLSKLTFRLVPAKRYVKMRYDTFDRIEGYLAAIEGHHRAHDVDFMDGIIHSPNKYVLSLGWFVDEAPYTNRYDWVKAYHESTAVRKEDFLETPDYFFRYDRGVTHVHPESTIGRFLFGKFLGSTQLLWLAQNAPWLLKAREPSVTLDVFLPISKAPAFLEWHTRELGHYPLWCVPYRRVRDYEWLSPDFYKGVKDELFVDIAIYGMKHPPGKNAHRMIEEKLRELGGVKTLIDHNYYTEEEFWETWNRPNYEQVKAITDPDNVLRDLYTKTCKVAMGVKENHAAVP